MIAEQVPQPLIAVFQDGPGRIRLECSVPDVVVALGLLEVAKDVLKAKLVQQPQRIIPAAPGRLPAG